VTAEEAYQIKQRQALNAAIGGGTGAMRASDRERVALRDFNDKRKGNPLVQIARGETVLFLHTGGAAVDTARPGGARS
jgi:hypothetical protein